MDQHLITIYQAVARVKDVIATASTIDAALREGLRTLQRVLGVQHAIVWYAEGEQGAQVLRPYFWLSSSDLSSLCHATGEGSVGRVFQTRRAERMIDYQTGDDPATEADLTGTAIRSMVVVPFSTKQRDLGVFQLINKADGSTFTEEEADVCEIFAMLASLSLSQHEELDKARRLDKAIIEIRDVTREYVNGDTVTHVLKGVNLNVYEGEFLVLLGESGCGKSTLVNIVAGMDTPTAGSVTFMGTQIVGATHKELTAYRRNNIGFVFQNYNLMPNLNARQNLNLVGELVADPIPSDHALELVGLANRMGNYPSQMSGGQQQRVSIARALVKRPRLIFADEPTAALDYATSIEILQVMGQIVQDGTTLVMVTHNEEICRMADRVVRIRDGRVHEVTINRTHATATDLVW